MPSPFPGMNPYLEQEDAWHDFHERFMPAAAEVLSAQVDPRYIVKIDEHVYVHEMAPDSRRFLGRADVTVATVLTVPIIIVGFLLGVRFESGPLGIVVFIGCGRQPMNRTQSPLETAWRTSVSMPCS